MLEEALTSTTSSPAEAALTFISFVEVELGAGGAAAESRFFKLFSMLCERVFGVINPKDDFKHDINGWLSRASKWERPPTNSSSSRQTQNYGLQRPTHGATSSTLASDPVVKLLGARAAGKSQSSRDNQQALTLMEACAREAEHRPNVRYPLPFHALPKSTQEAWIALLEAALGGSPAPDTPPSENSTRLLGSLFRVKPVEQVHLRHHQQAKAQKKDQRRPLQLSPKMYQASPLSPSTSTSNPAMEKDAQPNITLSMLEYYLLLFIRYPLSTPSPPAAQSTKQQPQRPPGVASVPLRRSEPYGESVYYHLFQEYVNYYIPSTSPQGQSSGFPSLNRPSELFLRITIELWLEGQNQVSTTSKAVKALQDRKGENVSIDLSTSYELVRSKYDPPPRQIARCLHKLIARAISDGAMLDMVKDVHGGFRGANPEILCLSPTLTILQTPFYNYVRNAFRHSSIHAKQSPFYAALDDWLVWLEPWNTRYGTTASTNRIMDTVSRAQTGQLSSSRVVYPRATQRSTYKTCWEPFIASNLYLYTVPLAIFLRRARELDFSPREYQRSLSTVRRVLRVFTPEVVAVINKLLSGQVAKYAAMVARHEANLGPHAPPKTVISLESCQGDMHNLLEEVHLQHLKKVDELDGIESAIAYIGGLFGQGINAGEGREIQTLFTQAKRIVSFPRDYEVAPASRAPLGDTQARQTVDSHLERNLNGYFSEAGRDNILSGLSKCEPQDVGYDGDRMLGRPQSHEISILVPVMVQASVRVNNWLGLRSDGGGQDTFFSFLPRRFNFRFFADYRNLVFLWLCFWFFRRS